jgi:CHC2 zinc finger
VIPASDLAVARSRLIEVARADIALKRSGDWWTGRCPFHDDRKPSFGIRGEHWCCFSGCGRGDAISYVQRRRGLGFREAVKWLLESSTTSSPVKTNAYAEKQRENAGVVDSAIKSLHSVRKILSECGPVERGTAAWLYLQSRGLKPNQPGLRAHPALWCQEVGGALPALVAPIINSEGEVCAVHRTWCTERVVYDGTDPWADARAPLQARKKGLGPYGDGAVRLAPAGAVHGLAEGIESAIAASMLYRVPVWASCGLSRLGYPAHWTEPQDGSEPRWVLERVPTIWVPPEVQRLFIFGDRGQVGETVALFAAWWWTGRGLPAQAILPGPGFQDFADQLIGKRRAA